MTTWLHIGSSPSVVDTLPRAIDEHSPDVVMTCNAGIDLHPFPDVYVCCDSVASVRWYFQAKSAQANGCRLVTLWRDSERARLDRQIEHYDEFLPGSGPAEFDGKNYTAFRFTGALCLQYAVLNGCTTLVLVGCDGWRDSGDYFDGREGCGKQMGSKRERLAEQFREIVAASPQVQFVRYGRPCFAVDFPNWQERN